MSWKQQIAACEIELPFKIKNSPLSPIIFTQMEKLNLLWVHSIQLTSVRSVESNWISHGAFFLDEFHHTRVLHHTNPHNNNNIDSSRQLHYWSAPSTSHSSTMLTEGHMHNSHTPHDTGILPPPLNHHWWALFSSCTLPMFSPWHFLLLLPLDFLFLGFRFI